MQCALLSAAASGVPVDSLSWERFCTDGGVTAASAQHEALLDGEQPGRISEATTNERPSTFYGGYVAS